MKFNPQGNIVATGEDGVPWELYENGYLLFKPEVGKDTLTNLHPAPSWKSRYGDKILAIGFTNKVYAPKDSSYLFSQYNKNRYSRLPKLEYIETYKIDTSNVENMTYMFYEAENLRILDINKWDTSNVTDMTGMFCHAIRLKMLDLSNWNTSNVKNMSFMFSDSTNLQYLNIANWQIGNIDNMLRMFFGDTNMHQMFYRNHNLKLVDCSKVKTSTLKTKDYLADLLQQGTIEIPNDCTIILPKE